MSAEIQSEFFSGLASIDTIRRHNSRRHSHPNHNVDGLESISDILIDGRSTLSHSIVEKKGQS